MTSATRNDILSVFPGLEDHTLVEILDVEPTVDDLEAVFALLTSDDEDLIDVKRREGGRIHRLMSILNQAGVPATADRDR